MAADPCISWLKAIAEETRWRIVSELLGGPKQAIELEQWLGVAQYNVSKHLRILRDAGIVEGERRGGCMECSVSAGFRRRLKKDRTTLDLGCCTFHFDRSGR